MKASDVLRTQKKQKTEVLEKYQKDIKSIEHQRSDKQSEIDRLLEEIDNLDTAYDKLVAENM